MMNFPGDYQMGHGLETYIRDAAEMLFDLGSECENTKPINGNKMIFPLKKQPQKNKVKRVSEQELRQCFIEVIKGSEFFYSVETPTIFKYRKTGSIEKSGNLDLCLYSIENSEIVREVCIEFKAHNMEASYYFDLYKTTRESGNNLYYHLLSSMNNGTLTASTSKRTGLLVKLQQDLRSLNINNIHSESLTIAIVCMSPRLVIYQSISKDNLQKRNYSLVDFTYRVERKQLEIIDNNNWSVLIK
ncbi:MAG: hypothetical protein WC179_03850 [Candidatus Cloacimonadaceae bacterium]|jgi:hypothetical protein|nr:hypothetical protein [Candidatus Cloacimonadota bacterium]MCB5257626.1 hypothetical protein [Candidatus Cloacimonadota bacterium]MDD5624688.1 hypothetical protein [Candidatus Cloacimonadota bacterium]